jgi:8-oxo-dGTP pyrophosphatase MutT (NUDIX family)
MNTPGSRQHRPWRTLSSELVLDNRWARVRRDICELPNGHIIPDYYYWEGGDFAQVFALTASNQILLIRQYRQAIKQVVLELPGGLLDPADPDPLQTARRELEEETGYTSQNWTRLGALSLSASKSTMRAHAFLAQNVTPSSATTHELTEDLEIVLVSLDEFHQLVSTGAINDACSIAITHMALAAIR